MEPIVQFVGYISTLIGFLITLVAFGNKIKDIAEGQQCQLRNDIKQPAKMLLMFNGGYMTRCGSYYLTAIGGASTSNRNIFGIYDPVNAEITVTATADGFLVSNSSNTGILCKLFVLYGSATIVANEWHQESIPSA